MSVFFKIFKYFAEYFVFIVGLIFIFVIGFFYAYIKPEGLIFNIVFLIITLGWVIFIVRYFWELIEKNDPKQRE
jgi:hypothetical protein